MGKKGNVIVKDYEILARANQFKKATKTLKEDSETIVPMEVNACFTCELYLKYLVYFKKNNVQEIESTIIKSQHNLKKLYDELGDISKEMIKNEMQDEFENRLEKAGVNFQKIRYEYEYEEVTFSPGFLLQFMDVLSEICNN